MGLVVEDLNATRRAFVSPLAQAGLLCNVRRKMSRLPASGEIEVDAVRYGWALRHIAGSPSPYAGAQGTSVSVFLPGRKNKELVIDFAIEDPFFDRPKTAREFQARLIACVRGALVHGWNPEARGKPYRVDAADVEAAT